MKRIAYSLLASLALSVPSQAIVGGPFDNNLFFGREINGTFQGTITAKNFSGIMIFGVAPTSDPDSGSYSAIVGSYGNDGRFVSFYDGVMVVGQVSSIIDTQSRKISGILAGSFYRKNWVWSETYVKTISSTGTEFETVNFQMKDVVNITGDFTAGFAQSYPSLTYDGKANLELLTTQGTKDENGTTVADLKTEEIEARVRGIKTSNQSPFFGNQLPPIDVPGIVILGADSEE